MADQKEKEKEKDNRFQDLKNGPLSPSNRECRDVICCILMVANLLAMVILAIYGYTYGNTHDIYRATDNNKNICGKSNTSTSSYPYAYFFNPTTGNLNNRICVKECPSYSNGVLSSLNCFTNANTNSCAYTKQINQDGTFNSTFDASDFIGYGSIKVIDRVCIPQVRVFENAFKDYANKFSDGVRQSGISNFITDLQNNWRWLLLALALSIVISLILMFCFRCLAGCIVWLSILIIFLGTIGLGILFLYNGGTIKRQHYIGNLGIQIPTLPPNQYYNIFGYISFGLSALFLIIICCCCSRIRLAIAICGVAGKFVASTCQVFFVPLIMGAIIIVLWVAAVFAMIGLIGGADFVVSGNDIFTSIADYKNNYLAMFYYYVFATLWTNAFLQAIAIFIIAAACGFWYYNQAGPQSEQQRVDSPVCNGFWMVIRFYFGSLAFGSLILAIIQFIQFLIEIFNKQIESSGTQNACTKCVINCLRCCVGCLQRIVSCLNRNAFILIALTGKGFCSASADALAMITSNPLRYGVVTGIGQILMFLGKLIIAGATTALFYVLITFVKDIKANVLQPIYLLILVFIVSYAIAVIFMVIYSVAMQTILACFIIDETNNKRAIYAPPQLQQLMDNKD